MQLRGILQRLDGHGWHYASVALAVLAIAIVVRLVWVTDLYMAFLRVTPRASIGGAIAISRCGMRGIVTLAAGLALPERFPYRDLLELRRQERIGDDAFQRLEEELDWAEAEAGGPH